MASNVQKTCMYAYETSKPRAWPEQCSSTTLKAVRRTLERYKNDRERDRGREREEGRMCVCMEVRLIKGRRRIKEMGESVN